ncbi:MAG: tRNA pseudouridine(38-40) synthase TruA [Clostridia bacterium]|nr:tRNA pseudouridine(38-40) synthase TruA [Clostridia bacterium]
MRIKITVSYDGTAYCGWQVQPNGVTVQEVLENALFLATGERARITGSGRTDAGVHAIGQVAHFDTESSIPSERFYKALNAHLPPDVRVIKSESADENFHACTSAKRKTYAYSLYVSDVENPLKDRFAVKVDVALDIARIKAVAKEFIGEHDFKAFCASGSGAKTTVRTIYSVDIKEVDGDIKITVTGNGFLYNMVRIMVGTLLCVGEGKLDALAVKTALETGVRPAGIKTLPAKGLCLIKAEY